MTSEPPYPYQPTDVSPSNYAVAIRELRQASPQPSTEYVPALITEDWLASVGFKYSEPGERQQFRHWKLTFFEPDDYGMYLETTMPGHINAAGEHVGADRGWFLWLGREHKLIHLRHVWEQSEIVAVVEALTGEVWVPSKMGHVPVRKRKG